MSRIGKQPIELHSGFNVAISPGRVQVNGPLGELSQSVPARMQISQEDGSLVVKASRPQKFKVRNYTRCRRCGRPRAVYRKFGLCRICLRELAHEGSIPGMTKSSW